MKITTTFSKDIGQMFKQVRIDQGMTLAEAAGTEGSASALSRFERGETDISVAQAQLVARHMGLGQSDLRRMLGTRPTAFPGGLELAIKCQNRDLIQKYRDRYLAVHTVDADNSLQKVIRIMFKYALLETAIGVQLSVDEEQQLAVFLRYPILSDVHNCVLLACLPFASAELLMKLPQWWQLRKVLSFGEMPAARWQLLMVLSWCALARNNQQLLNIVMPLVQSVLSTPTRQIPIYSSLSFCQRENELRQNPNGTGLDELMRDMARIENYCGNSQCSWMRQRLKEAQKPLPIVHNGLLQEPEFHEEWAQCKHQVGGTWQWSAADGADVRIIRQRYQLTIRQVAVNWTAPSQLRYEQEKMDLRFCNYLELMDRMVVFSVSNNEVDSDVNPVARAIGLVQGKMGLPGENEDKNPKVIGRRIIDVLRNTGTDWPKWMIDVGVAAVPLLIEEYMGKMPSLVSEQFASAIRALQKAKRLTPTELSVFNNVMSYVETDDLFAIWQTIFEAASTLPEGVVANANYIAAGNLMLRERGDLAQRMLATLQGTGVSYTDCGFAMTTRMAILFLERLLRITGFEEHSTQFKKILMQFGWEYPVRAFAC